jgi:hypothetical protein
LTRRLLTDVCAISGTFAQGHDREVSTLRASADLGRLKLMAHAQDPPAIQRQGSTSPAMLWIDQI